jgi:hypothetical protein
MHILELIALVFQEASLSASKGKFGHRLMVLSGHDPWPASGGCQNPDGCEPLADDGASVKFRMGSWGLPRLFPRSHSMGTYLYVQMFPSPPLISI